MGNGDAQAKPFTPLHVQEEPTPGHHYEDEEPDPVGEALEALRADLTRQAEEAAAEQVKYQKIIHRCLEMLEKRPWLEIDDYQWLTTEQKGYIKALRVLIVNDFKIEEHYRTTETSNDGYYIWFDWVWENQTWKAHGGDVIRKELIDFYGGQEALLNNLAIRLSIRYPYSPYAQVYQRLAKELDVNNHPGIAILLQQIFQEHMPERECIKRGSMYEPGMTRKIILHEIATSESIREHQKMVDYSYLDHLFWKDVRHERQGLPLEIGNLINRDRCHPSGTPSEDREADRGDAGEKATLRED
jgi:hypothetical protein